MKKRLLYGSGIVALAILVALLVWQGSFSLGDYGPENPTQTYLYWAISTLVFLLTLTLGFMLLRTAVKLYIERRSNREGSRIKTKLVVGALALSFLPVFFLVLWSVYVLNRNLDKWLSRPAEGVRTNLQDIRWALESEARAQASWLGSLPETRRYLETGVPAREFFDRFCRENDIAEALLERSGQARLPLCGPLPADGAQLVRVSLRDVSPPAWVVVQTSPLAGLAQKQREISSWLDEYAKLSPFGKSARGFYLRLLFLLTLFILFVATWMALFLARQISVPISALLDAAGEVRKGNLGVPRRGQGDRRTGHPGALLQRDDRGPGSQPPGTGEPAPVHGGDSGEHPDRRHLALRRRPHPEGQRARSTTSFREETVARAERLEDLFGRDDTAEIKYLMKRARRTGLASSQMELKTERQKLHLAVTVSALETKLTSGFCAGARRHQRAAARAEGGRLARGGAAHRARDQEPADAHRAFRRADRAATGPRRHARRRPRRSCANAPPPSSRRCESLKTLVDEFSQFARFPAAQPAPADLNEVVESGLGVFAGRLDGIELRKDLAPNLPPVNIDREQFKRVVVNLVDNAAEAMQDSLVKRLYVATQATAADTVELIIADTGCGISAEEKEKLFLPYFSTKGRGTGLGLAIVSHIVAEHNAHIRVEDNFPAGARFVIEIPALASSEAESQAGGGARMKPPASWSSTTSRASASRCAAFSRTKATRRTPSPAARPAWTSSRKGYELVLLDIWLPGMDGLETLARIQEIPFAERPVVVMISGHGNIETAVKATKLGAFDFLEKPLTIEKVTVVVKNALQHRRLELENLQLKGRGRVQVPDHRRERADEGAAPAIGADGGHQRPRADLRRKRHRQGAGRPRHPRHEPARRGAFRRGQLRRDPRGADRERAVRPSQGQLHAARTRTRSASSRRPTAARCFSTRSAT